MTYSFPAVETASYVVKAFSQTYPDITRDVNHGKRIVLTYSFPAIETAGYVVKAFSQTYPDITRDFNHRKRTGITYSFLQLKPQAMSSKHFFKHTKT